MGKKECGKVEAISEEVEEVGGVRISMKRAGVGYHGERLQRTGFVKNEQHLLNTV